MKLHHQVKLQKLRADEVDRRLMQFRDYLYGPKFAGHNPQDGTPNNWIATHEVLALISDLRDTLDGVEDDILVQDANITLD